jgi:hypothetical protein
MSDIAASTGVKLYTLRLYASTQYRHHFECVGDRPVLGGRGQRKPLLWRLSAGAWALYRTPQHKRLARK